ncbi:MAG: hypothetical protein WC359_14110 [Dehalococcoidia bacterium]|jgi:hypothetical protein
MTEFIRGEHQKDFTLLSNKTLRDVSLSWKARGLLAYLLSHSEGYHIRADNLHQFSSDGISATRSGIRELTQAGYIGFQKQQDSTTKAWIAGHWIISEEANLPKGLRVSKPKDAKRTLSLSQTQPFAPPYKKIQKKEEQKKEEQKKEEPFFLKIEHFVKRFYTIQRERFPNIVKNTPQSQIAQACDTIGKLVRIDGYTLPQVIKAVTWTLDDNFWSTNVHSIVGLRGRSGNGSTKFQNILAQMEKQAPPPQREPEARRFPADNSDYGNSMGIRDVDFK